MTEIADAVKARADSKLKRRTRFETGDHYKDSVQEQWDQDACGSHYVKDADEDTLEWYLEVEEYRYGTYAPWMPKVMEFSKHRGESVLEIGGGLGTDLAQFAKGGAICTDLDLSAGHLAHAERNFNLRGYKGEFVHGDGENLPFDDKSFDVVYSNGVIHHTPNTNHAVRDIYRVLRPGGKVIIMVYAENSWHYWYEQIVRLGLQEGLLANHSTGYIMSCSVERNEHGQRPLVKVYARSTLKKMFNDFRKITIRQRQMVKEELPKIVSWVPISIAGRIAGWNLILKAYK